MDKILKELSNELVNNVMYMLNGNRSSVLSSKKLLEEYFNILESKLLEQLNFRYDNYIYFQKNKLVNINKTIKKVETLVCRKYLPKADIKDTLKYLKTFEKYLENHKDIEFPYHKYIDITELPQSKLENLTKEVTEFLYNEITLSKILTPYFYSMVHLKYDARLYNSYDKVVQCYLKSLNIEDNSIFEFKRENLISIKILQEDRVFKNTQLCLLSKLLETINLELFGYKDNNFSKNDILKECGYIDILFNSNDIITIKKITCIIPLIIDRDTIVKENSYPKDFISKYQNGTKYYVDNNWYYKLKYYDIVKTRIIRSQYYYCSNNYKYNKYCYNYFKENNQNEYNLYNWNWLSALINCKEELLPKYHKIKDINLFKTKKTIFRYIDKLIILTNSNYKRVDSKKYPFGIPVKILDIFCIMINKYNDYIHYKDDSLNDILEDAKKVFTMMKVFEN